MMNKFLDRTESIEHCAQFILNMNDLVVIIDIEVNDILSSRVATSDQVCNNGGQNIFFDITGTNHIAIVSRNVKEVILSIVDFCGIVIIQPTNSFICDIVAVLPDQITSIAESVASRTEDIGNGVAEQNDFILNCLRGRRYKVVGDAKDIGILGPIIVN